MAQSQASKPVDPFQGKSILSLHPRTFRDSKVSLKSNDLKAIHQHMSSLVLQNPEKHFEEAKLIIDGGLEFPNSKENSEPNMKENENPKKNRPALARKRAKFSMKPDTSQTSTVVEPTFQMDQLHDPDDFFAAYDKFENTVKEIKRQRGEDPNEPKIPTTVRQRRPEIPRRKVSYQHHVYSSQPENDALSSQEAPQDAIESQPIHDSQHESVNPNCQSKEEVAGSVTKAEDKVNKLFDDLMSSDIADLDGNEALSYLKDRLKIKPVSITNLQLPNFHDIPTVNLFSSVNLIKDHNTLPVTRALSDNLKDITPVQQKLSDKPFSPLSSSPTPPRSPFLAISTFGKLMSKSVEVESVDPFSSRDIDLFPNTTSFEVTSGPATRASEDSHSDLLIGMENREQRHNVEEIDEYIHVNAEDIVEKATSPTKLNLNAENITDNLHREQATGENIEAATENVVSPGQPEEVAATDKVMSSCQPEENVEITTIEKSGSNRNHSDQTDDSSFKVPDASLPVQNPDIVPEQQNQEHPQTSTNKRKNTRLGKIDPKKRRNSLAGGGSTWTTGVRRSNRIKSKPLEYWKGERMLYARVHNSLPTVVGVKYISPSKPGFKVESFVADEYKDLVDWISLH